MEIPKRKFALEEKDLAIEADENNKVAEEKENRFLNRLQKDATDDIEHLPTEKVLERLPDPTNAQSAFVSVVVGAGAAWFGLYVGGTRQPKPESKE